MDLSYFPFRLVKSCNCRSCHSHPFIHHDDWHVAGRHQSSGQRMRWNDPSTHWYDAGMGESKAHGCIQQKFLGDRCRRDEAEQQKEIFFEWEPGQSNRGHSRTLRQSAWPQRILKAPWLPSCWETTRGIRFERRPAHMIIPLLWTPRVGCW